MSNPMKELYDTIITRKDAHAEGSYTNYLFEKGLDKILKKCGEECSEVIIAAINNDNNELVMAISYLLYDVTLTVEDINAELEKRSLKSNNLKQFHSVDKNS